MNATSRFLLTSLLPIVAIMTMAFAVIVVLLDLLALPIILLCSKKPRDEQPATSNASIIVLNWNGIDFLRELMPSLQIAVAKCPGDHEVIVTDNGSEDSDAQ